MVIAAVFVETDVFGFRRSAYLGVKKSAFFVLFTPTLQIVSASFWVSVGAGIPLEFSIANASFIKLAYVFLSFI